MKKILLCSVFLVFSTVLFAQNVEQNETKKSYPGVFGYSFSYGFVGDGAYTWGTNLGVNKFFAENFYGILSLGCNNYHSKTKQSSYGYTYSSSIDAYYIPIKGGVAYRIGDDNFSIDPFIIASLNLAVASKMTVYSYGKSSTTKGVVDSGLTFQVGAALTINSGLKISGRYNIAENGYFEIGIGFGIL